MGRLPRAAVEARRPRAGPLVKQQGPHSHLSDRLVTRPNLFDSRFDGRGEGHDSLEHSTCRAHFDYTNGGADRRRRVALDTATTMMAYSMNKTITAASVLRLVARRGGGIG
jgi:hypothetical protein